MTKCGCSISTKPDKNCKVIWGDILNYDGGDEGEEDLTQNNLTIFGEPPPPLPHLPRTVTAHKITADMRKNLKL